MPSKLHFLENQEAGFIDNTGHTVRPFIYWQGEKAQDRPSNSPERHQRFLQSADETYFSETSAVFGLNFTRTCETFQR